MDRVPLYKGVRKLPCYSEMFSCDSHCVEFIFYRGLVHERPVNQELGQFTRKNRGFFQRGCE